MKIFWQQLSYYGCTRRCVVSQSKQSHDYSLHINALKDVDTGTHLVGCARLWNNIPDFIAQGGLSEAASWIMLRQNLHISLIKGEPMQVDLNKYRRSRSFVDTTDEDFANRIILLCCQVLATCFSPGAQPDYETWAHLGKEVASWHDSIPAHYSPYHHSDDKSTSTGVKSAFPIVWMMNPAQGQCVAYFPTEQNDLCFCSNGISTLLSGSHSAAHLRAQTMGV